jgi:hypothetical protein
MEQLQQVFNIDIYPFYISCILKEEKRMKSQDFVASNTVVLSLIANSNQRVPVCKTEQTRGRLRPGQVPRRFQ